MSTTQLQEWARPRHILLATDLADLEYTLPVAIDQAQAYKAELMIAHVLPAPGASPIDPVLMAYCETERLHSAAETALARAVATASAAGVQCSSRLTSGEVVEKIGDIAAEWKADRLVAGTHGKEKFLLHILGSVAASLFHHMDIPVLAIGPQAVRDRKTTKESLRIVFATPLDYSSERLAEFALNVAENQSAEIVLLHVINDIAYAHPSSERVSEYSGTMLKNLLNGKGLSKCRPECQVVHGHPVAKIVQYAQVHEADMIIMGASAHSAFNERFLPGTAYRVLCESPCPVLVLKQESGWASTGKDATTSRGQNSAFMPLA